MIEIHTLGIFCSLEVNRIQFLLMKITLLITNVRLRIRGFEDNRNVADSISEISKSITFRALREPTEEVFAVLQFVM